MAEALEGAHEQGIVHRDLKPANIKVKDDSTPSPTITTPAMPVDWRAGHPEQGRGVTPLGVILGTAPYVSPEQARGREADKRSDIWAFGAVLYERLTGRQAFDGEDMVDILGAVNRLARTSWTAWRGFRRSRK